MDNLFNPFRPDLPVRRSHRNLPHWTQEGASYFVTFRTYDSLPRYRVERLKEMKQLWWRLSRVAPSAEGRLEIERKAFRMLDQWLDAGEGACVLRNSEAAAKVEEAILHFDGARYYADEFAVMPNHVHSLLMPRPGSDPAGTLHSWKSYTAKEINRLLSLSGQFWIRESFDHIVRDEAELERIRDYIRRNPLKANLKSGEFRLGRGIGIRTK